MVIPLQNAKNTFLRALGTLLKKGWNKKGQSNIGHRWTIESPPDSCSWPRCKNKSVRRPKSLWWPPWWWINMRKQERHMFIFSIGVAWVSSCLLLVTTSVSWGLRHLKPIGNTFPNRNPCQESDYSKKTPTSNGSSLERPWRCNDAQCRLKPLYFFTVPRYQWTDELATTVSEPHWYVALYHFHGSWHKNKNYFTSSDPHHEISKQPRWHPPRCVFQPIAQALQRQVPLFCPKLKLSSRDIFWQSDILSRIS